MTRIPPSRLPTLPPPISGWPLAVLVAVFLLTGTAGHDPWKIEDAMHFGVVWRALADGDWLSFRLAYGAAVEPPLYYWAGKLFGLLPAALIEPPGAVRLASTLFAALAGGALWLASRELHGREQAGAAPLLLIGCLGFLVQSHEAQPMMALIAALAAVLAGLATAPRSARQGGALLGAGLAGVLLAHGLTLLPAVAVILSAGLALAEQRPGRTRAILIGIALAGLLAAPWLLLLPTRDLDAFLNGELAQFGSPKSLAANSLRYTKLLAWFAWPALPLALWTLWQGRSRLASAAILLPLVATLALSINLIVVFEGSPVMALALLPSLALLGVPGLLTLRRGAGNAFDWFGRMTFSLLAGLIWLGWVAMQFGVPAPISRNFAKLAPGFVSRFDLAAMLVALIATLAWFWLLTGLRSKSPLRPAANWAAGMALLWLLAITLWLPWIEHGKSYRSVAGAIERAVVDRAACIATRGVGEAQLAAIDYFVPNRLLAETQRKGDNACPLLLTQSLAADGERWQLLWEGARPGDRSEKFRLYARR
jgi:4-amino-4-deoxy-L-arabinose transferase-like glycosyltransferase